MSTLSFTRHLGLIRAFGASLAGMALILAASLPSHAQGTTVLTFDFGPNSGVSDGSLVPQAYGDNVTAAVMGQFSYGGAAPFTPGVSTLYSGGTIGPSFRSTGYGDLTNVIVGEPSQLLLVTLSPSLGTSVTLNSFDLAALSRTSLTIDSVNIFGVGGSLLFSQNNVVVAGGASHTPFTFSNVTSTGSLTIQIDARNVGTTNIGLDNISFTQNPVSASAPEPGSIALLLTAALPIGAIVARRRRRLV